MENDAPQPTNKEKLDLIAAVTKADFRLVGLSLKQQALELNMDYDELLETQYQTALKVRAGDEAA